jgi:hypothetical protein
MKLHLIAIVKRIAHLRSFAHYGIIGVVAYRTNLISHIPQFEEWIEQVIHETQAAPQKIQKQ